MLNRLKASDDTESWEQFYRIYGKLVRDFALRAGLTDTEAEEVVQETAIAMARHLPEYHYNPKVCRFKTWLLNQASWRIKDQLKRRHRDSAVNLSSGAPGGPAVTADETARTSTINSVPDPAAVNLDVLFETEWRKNLLSMALERLKENFSLKQFQVFDLLVIKEWAAADVARALGMTLANVYVTRHRLSRALRKETDLLEKQFERAALTQAKPAD